VGAFEYSRAVWRRLDFSGKYRNTSVRYPVFSTGPSFNGPIFDLSAASPLPGFAKHGKREQADSLSSREQVILLVVSQYIGTLRNMADVQASQSRVDLAQALYDQAADRQKEGVSTGIDTLRANVELQTKDNG